MYTKILKELKKGNAVLLEVRFKHAVKHSVNRYRLVTPDTCEYTYAFSEFYMDGQNFKKSCFMDKPIESITPIHALVKRMALFDKINKLHINKMQVLE